MPIYEGRTFQAEGTGVKTPMILACLKNRKKASGWLAQSNRERNKGKQIIQDRIV